ncbi:MAG TPA: DUF1653 domain-containing protein [Candidatus Saccharimonadales bacterium]
MGKRLSQAELQQRLDDAASAVNVGKQYRHYKGNLYSITGVAIIEATNEPAVIYKAQYGKGLQFIRPIKDWTMTVEWQGETVPRFRLTD